MREEPDQSRIDRIEASLAATVETLEAMRAFQAELALEDARRREEEAKVRKEEAKRREEEAKRREEEAKRREEEAKRREEEAKLRREEEAKLRREEEAKRREEDRLRAAEYDRHQREWNRERGEIARKLGTLVEDMVSPSVPRVVSELFGITEDQIERHGIRQRVRRAGRGREFDVVTLFPGHVLIVESKTQLRPEDVAAFVASMDEVRELLPEVGDRRIIGAVASLYLDDSIVRYAERQGLIVMGLGDHLMEPKNTPGFRPREF